MDASERLNLVLRNSAEIVTEEELRNLLETTTTGKAYIGFEPSGLMHIGQGLICASKINDLTAAGFEVTIFMADWHAYINDKLGGNLENIRTCGKYMEECFLALGVDRTKVKFTYASELTGKAEYWERVLRIAKNATVTRIKRALTIMGRKESEAETDSSKLIYPSMQVADIFELGVDIAYGGMDQRKAHMLARDIAEKLHWKKPIALHTPLIFGLQGGDRMEAGQEAKMSKSAPETCIYLHDPPETIHRKLMKAYCPEKVVLGNPVLDICKFIVLNEKKTMKFEREARFGGPLEIQSYAELETKYRKGELHPADLKNAVSYELSNILMPARAYFDKKNETLNAVKKFCGAT